MPTKFKQKFIDQTAKAKAFVAAQKLEKELITRPTNEPTIEERSEFAAYALDQYGIKKQGAADYDSPETMAVDLITDLLHLIRAHGSYDPLNKLKLAQMHFEAEDENDDAPTGEDPDGTIDLGLGNLEQERNDSEDQTDYQEKTLAYLQSAYGLEANDMDINATSCAKAETDGESPEEYIDRLARKYDLDKITGF